MTTTEEAKNMRSDINIEGTVESIKGKTVLDDVHAHLCVLFCSCHTHRPVISLSLAQIVNFGLKTKIAHFGPLDLPRHSKKKM